MKNRALLTSGLVFVILATTHLLRLFYPFEVSINDYCIPLWGSAIAFLTLGLLAAFMFRSLLD